MSRARAALTLFEVLVATLVLVVAVLGTVALLPAGIRTQQSARYGVYASTLALSLMDNVHNPELWWWNVGHRSVAGRAGGRSYQGMIARDTLLAGVVHGSALAPDVERYLCTGLTGALPLPAEIARRLDSPDGELERVVAAGGQLLYPDPAVLRGVNISAARALDAPAHSAPEIQHLVFAVVSPAQHNLQPRHPLESWPFTELYPFPPYWLDPYGAADHQDAQLLVADPVAAYAAIRDGAPRGRWHGGNWKHFADTVPGSLWARSWPAFARLAGDREAGWLRILTRIQTHSATGPRGPKPAVTPPTRAERVNYRDRALRLWQLVKPDAVPTVPPTVVELPYTGALGDIHPPAATNDDTPLAPAGAPTGPGEYCYRPQDLAAFVPVFPEDLPAADFPPHPAQVLALSYLAHAAMLCAVEFEDADRDGALDAGEDLDVDGVLTSPTAIDRLFARQVHEMCLRWALSYQLENPNDWGAPRPANRQLMTDHPLVLLDPWWDASRTTASPQGLAELEALGYGRALRYPRDVGTRDESFHRWIDARDPVGGGRAIRHLGPMDAVESSATYAAVRAWRADHRLRGPIAGSDDRRFWVTDPFAPEHRARELVFWAVDWKRYEDSEMVPTAPLDPARYNRYELGGELRRRGDNANHGSWLVGNPENNYLWTGPEREVAYGRDTIWTGGSHAPIARANVTGTSVDQVLGHWGADRNNNARFDRGDVPADARMRAAEVARFTVYDPVMYLHVRN